MNGLTLPTNINGALLPASYEAAKVALAECSKVDECKSWSDKAAAIASYARQSDDKTLEHMAGRIRARAIRRTGELLQDFHSAGGQPTHDGAVKSSRTQAQVGRDAGLSERQISTASAIAKIPEAEFEAAVESEYPPPSRCSGMSEEQLREDYSARFGVYPATKAAWIATCPYFLEETPISRPPMALSGLLGVKWSPEGAKSVPAGLKTPCRASPLKGAKCTSPLGPEEVSSWTHPPL